MLRKSSKFLIFAVVIAAVALFAVTKAGAGTCPDPILTTTGDCPASLEGTCCATIHDDFLNADWVVEVVPDASTGFFPDPTPIIPESEPEEPLCTDNRGNEISSYGFLYLVHPPTDGVLTHLAVTMPAPTEDCAITKVCPKDNSTKFGPDFNGFTPLPHLWVAGTSAIKTLSSDKDLASFGTTYAAADAGTIVLWTGNGGELKGAIWTPSCCSEAHIETSRSFFTALGVAPTVVEYDICTGEPSAPTTTTVGSNYQLVEAAYICDGVSEFDSQLCTQIKRIATRAGGLINVCINDENYVYFGHGNSIYRVRTGTSPGDCNDVGVDQNFAGPCEQEVVFDGKLRVRYAGCGNALEKNQACLIDPNTGACNFTDFVLLNGQMTLCSTNDTKGKITYDCGYITDGGSGLGVPISNKWYFISGRWVWR